MQKDNYQSFHPNIIEKLLTKPTEIDKIKSHYNTTKNNTIEIKDTLKENTTKPNRIQHHEKGLELIEKEILVNNDKLITNLDVSGFDIDVELAKTPNKTTKVSNELNRSVNLGQKPLKLKDNTNSRSANISPIRANNTQLQKKIVKVPISAQKKTKEKVCPQTVSKVRDVHKFINKPKSGITTTDTSRNNSITTTLKKKKSTLLTRNVPNGVKTPKRPNKNITSIPAANRNENNNKVITDLQAMFGKKVEHFEEMYPNLCENDKKNLISALLTLTFDLKAQNDTLLKNNTRGLSRSRAPSQKRIMNTPTTPIRAHKKSNSVSYPDETDLLKKS